ncbi:MAG: site-2 protease family protein [Ktedonobacterales bacterium]
MIAWYYYLAAIPVFALLVLVHEFGHFITAKWAGIRVDEFALGFPPRIAGIKRGETMYSINLLPLGGYVKMPGENGDMYDDSGTVDPRTFAAKPASKRLIVLLAGVTMNLLLAIVLFSAAEAVGQVQFPTTIGSVEQSSPAAAAGLAPGDRIITVDGQPVKYFSDVQTVTTQDIQKALAANKNATTAPIVITYRAKGSSVQKTVTVQARTKPPTGQGYLGIGLDEQHAIHLSVPIWQAPIKGVQDVGTVTVETGQGIQQIIRGILPINKAVSGPVGIVSITGQVASSVPIIGWYWLLFLAGALSLNLAFVNILPIPALDGGRVLLVLIEVLRRGKRLSPEREGLVNLIGMGALLFLIALVTVSDVGNIFIH